MKLELTKLQAEILFELLEEDLHRTRSRDMQYKAAYLKSLKGIFEKLEKAYEAGETLESN